MNYNVILDTDSYKLSHYKQYPFQTGYVSSYVESRGGKFDKVLFAGLQILLKNLEANPITMAMVDEAQEIVEAHGLPFHRKGWLHIVEKHDGRLPLLIEAVPEGTLVDTKNVLVQIRNTDPAVPWLTSYMETAVLRAVWYPTTVATMSFETLRVIREHHEETVGNLDAIPFALHDFGSRGVSSRESAGIGGLAHLFNSMGTDTVEALLFARRYYGADMAGFSVPASEHSTATSWGRERETEYARHMLTAFEQPIISVVSDSYDVYHMTQHVWGKLNPEVARSGKKIVIRPDSGDPVMMLRNLFRTLELCVGYDLNDKGYKVLPPHFGVIQGDGVNNISVREILDMLKTEGWAANNIVFGMGGALLQQLDRDTQKFAMKASAIIPNEDQSPYVAENWTPIQKCPVTDSGKVSKTGILILTKSGDSFQTLQVNDITHAPFVNCLKTVFEDGRVVIDQSLDEIRGRVRTYY
jgi:nicotinamide phosphoribosyltransferase